MTYSYPKPKGCYHWNLLKRAELVTGVKPMGTQGTDEEFHIMFAEELTHEQKNKLDDLMVQDAQNPPKTNNTVFRIMDISERFDDFKKMTGVNIQMFFSESVADSGNVDVIEMHCDRKLTYQEKENFKRIYAKLIEG